MPYKLPCSCGSFVLVETNQAGRPVQCPCGNSLQVPSLSRIKELEQVATKGQTVLRRPEPRRPSEIKSPEPFRAWHAFIMITLALLIVANTLLFDRQATYFRYHRTIYLVLGIGIDTLLLIVAWGGFLKVRRIPIRTKHLVIGIGMVTSLIFGLIFIVSVRAYPKLYDVCTMSRYYVHDGKVIGRDTQPISQRDFRLLVDERIVPGQYVVLSESMINQNPFYDQYPLYLIELHDNLKGNLALSYNFHEKYDQLVFYYWARFIVFAFLIGISLLILITGLLMSKHTEDIGERGGETWE